MRAVGVILLCIIFSCYIISVLGIVGVIIVAALAMIIFGN